MEDKTRIVDLDSTIKLLQRLSLHTALTGDQLSPSTPTATTTTTTTTTAATPVNFDRSQWVDFLVNEMASATSMEDARSQASKALEIMGRQVVGLPTVQEVDMLKKENIILKRAVCIQYQQVKKLEEEKETLVMEYKEKLRCLEADNYALSLRLKQVPASSLCPHMSFFPPPDVY